MRDDGRLRSGSKPHMDVVVHHTTVASDFALCRSQWRITGTDRSGKPVEVHHHAMEVMRRLDNGEWVFFIDHPWGATCVDRRRARIASELAHSTVTTRFPTEADLKASKIKQLVDLINQVYDDAESGMWRRPGMRTNPGEVECLLNHQALILAAEIDGMLVGAVNVNLINDGNSASSECSWQTVTTAERGSVPRWSLMLENWARDVACHTMRLELLAPRNWTHPSKEFLKQWYSRIGYTPQVTEPFEILHPESGPPVGNRVRLHGLAPTLNRSNSLKPRALSFLSKVTSVGITFYLLLS